MKSGSLHFLRGAMSFGMVLLFCLSGCTKPQHYLEVMREQRNAMKEMTAILAKVHDQKSMAEAKTALDEKQAEFDVIARKMKALPNPSEQVRAELKQEEFVMKRTLDLLREEVGRVRKLPGGEAFFQQFASQDQNLLQAVQP